jgi:hypothetical protein
VASSCRRGYASVAALKGGKFLTCLRCNQFLKKTSDPWMNSVVRVLVCHMAIFSLRFEMEYCHWFLESSFLISR